MGDRSIFGERSGSAPEGVASAPIAAIRRNPCRGLFGTQLIESGAAGARPRTIPPLLSV